MSCKEATPKPAAEARNKPAVSVSNVSKSYNIYATPRARLKQFVAPPIRRAMGLKERQYYRQFHALHNISFEVGRGETFGIVGKNGSGKSTLLQIICGTLSQSAGEVATQGRVAALLELGAGFNPEFSGRDNVYMNGRLLGLTTEKIDARFDRIAAFADIGDFIEQPVKTYSSGMYVRLAFGVIANVDADILIIDEALAVGDAYFVQKCMRFLREFMDHGTLLFVSHDTAAVQSLCSRAMLLSGGKTEMIDTPKKVARRYLENLYSEQQDIDGTSTSEPASPDSPPLRSTTALEQARDMRLDMVNQSAHRSELEIFRFKPDSEKFGTGLVEIESVRFLDSEGRPLQWIVGGEQVVLEIITKANAELTAPIIGFELKNRLGQTVFGDNTHLSTLERDLQAQQGQAVKASFDFRMPVMPAGDYSVAVAVADGSQAAHVQHQWRHDALIVRIHSDSLCFGVVGIPMRRIELVVSE